MFTMIYLGLKFYAAYIIYSTDRAPKHFGVIDNLDLLNIKSTRADPKTRPMACVLGLEGPNTINYNMKYCCAGVG
jgi:hypothetical protein